VAYPPDATLQVIALAVLSAAGFGVALVTTHSGLKHIATSVIVLGTVALSSRRQVGASVSRRSDLWLPWTSAMLRALAQVLSKAGLALWPNPFAAALREERLSRHTLVGVGLTVAGVVLLLAR